VRNDQSLTSLAPLSVSGAFGRALSEMRALVPPEQHEAFRALAERLIDLKRQTDEETFRVGYQAAQQAWTAAVQNVATLQRLNGPMASAHLM
jgi:predicted lipid-binding transport protein (Tim44 family)